MNPEIRTPPQIDVAQGALAHLDLLLLLFCFPFRCFRYRAFSNFEAGGKGLGLGVLGVLGLGFRGFGTRQYWGLRLSVADCGAYGA